MAEAIVLVSGGLDSATVLAVARRSFNCLALSFDYGQRHSAELAAARRVCASMGIAEHRIVRIPSPSSAGRR